ncbi:MAG: CYTH domain-containing protein [Deltaproteobacteria bacterium]|nr:CYTH domain-containing protein [Deltaproteobacteria bacterium]
MATEVELKLLLPDELAHGLVRAALDAAAGPGQVVEQVNYYLDTRERRLQAHRCMIRVRVGGQGSERWVKATCKANPTLLAGLLTVGEFEHRLPADLAQRWLQGPPFRSHLQDLQALDWAQADGPLARVLPPDAALHVLGAMATTRRIYALDKAFFGGEPGPLTLELDHARFGDRGADAHRFEIEIEHPDAAALEPRISAWLQDLGVHAWPADETKFAQLLRILDKPESLPRTEF